MTGDDRLARKRLRCGAFMPPWMLPLGMDPTLAIRQEIDFLEFLDEVGYDEAWVGEHHSGGMELIASPEILMAAAIERTTRIRIGSGVISLPYHHPFMVADRVVQLDHQARGRAMFGFGPGLLPSDAMMLGISPDKQRGRMAEALEIVLRLLAGEVITYEGEWFELREAFLQNEPFTAPRPHVAVASAITPSGGKLAGRLGLGMLCVAAASPAGFDVLDVNWQLANETAAENGRVMDRSALRLVAPFHVAFTRDQAIAEVREGFDRWQRFMDESLDGASTGLGYESIEAIIENKVGAIGSPEDAVEVLERFWEKTGGFGCILSQVTNWASYDDTKRSHRLLADAVMPAFAGRCERRHASHEWSCRHSQVLAAAAKGAAQKAIDEHFHKAGEARVSR